MFEEKSDISFEEELEMLGIDFDDCQYLSDGSYGYFFILVTDLDDDQEKKLSEHLDYNQITDDLWYRRLENPSEIPEEIRKRIIDYRNKKDIERIEKDYLIKIRNRWEIIVRKKGELNEI